MYNVDYGNEGDRFDVIGFEDGQARTVKITPPGEGYALKSISTSKDSPMLLHLQKDHVKYVFIEKIEFD